MQDAKFRLDQASYKEAALPRNIHFAKGQDFQKLTHEHMSINYENPPMRYEGMINNSRIDLSEGSVLIKPVSTRPLNLNTGASGFNGDNMRYNTTL